MSKSLVYPLKNGHCWCWHNLVLGGSIKLRTTRVNIRVFTQLLLIRSLILIWAAGPHFSYRLQAFFLYSSFFTQPRVWNFNHSRLGLLHNVLRRCPLGCCKKLTPSDFTNARMTQVNDLFKWYTVIRDKRRVAIYCSCFYIFITAHTIGSMLTWHILLCTIEIPLFFVCTH